MTDYIFRWPPYTFFLTIFCNVYKKMFAVIRNIFESVKRVILCLRKTNWSYSCLSSIQILPVTDGASESRDLWPRLLSNEYCTYKYRPLRRMYEAVTEPCAYQASSKWAEDQSVHSAGRWITCHIDFAQNSHDVRQVGRMGVLFMFQFGRLPLGQPCQSLFSFWAWKQLVAFSKICLSSLLQIWHPIYWL